MANTYSQIYIHLVFAVSGRLTLIRNEWKNELYKYITGIIKNENQKLMAINGTSDHVHLLVGIKPEISLSNLVRDIKSNSSRFLNEKHKLKIKFKWQEGFGAFSYSYSMVDTIVKYINNQENHHRKKSLREEYIEILEKFHIKYEDKYIFN